MNSTFKKYEKDHKLFDEQWRESKYVRGLLEKVFKDKLETTTSVTKSDYDTPSWSHKQAHFNGKAEAYREILKLLN